MELRTDLRKRGIDICSSQEMRLCGAKSYSIEHERGKNIYKLPCFGGVSVTLLKKLNVGDDFIWKICLVLSVLDWFPSFVQFWLEIFQDFLIIVKLLSIIYIEIIKIRLSTALTIALQRKR